MRHSIICRKVQKTFNYGKYIIPILLFSLMAIGALSLFINNFGIEKGIKLIDKIKKIVSSKINNSLSVA